MSFYDIRLLYIRELRAAFRERGVVVNSVLVPLLLYPLLLWLIFSAIGFIQGREERMPSRTLLFSTAAAHEEFVTLLEEDGRTRLVDSESVDDPEAALRSGDLDLVATFEESRAGAEAPVNFRVSVMWNSAENRSARAKRRLEANLQTYRTQWLERAAAEFQISPVDWLGFEIELENVASGEDVGAFLLGLMVPMLMMIMIAVGCFYPAVDATAGERERSTWETSMTLGVSHTSILVAKYLYVATLGGLAGLLNLLAMTISMAALLKPMLGQASDAVSFKIPWLALPVMLVATFVFALMVAAGMMLFAVFARTFKEGQSMIAPVYMLSLLPPLLVTSPDLELNFKWALVPVANVCLLFRQAIAGDLDPSLTLLVMAVQLVVIVAFLAAARWVLTFEDVVVGSYEGSLGRLLKERWRGGSGTSRDNSADQGAGKEKEGP